jgi:hypothetical protein
VRHPQLQGFRGIFRGAGKKKTGELNADDMASRLRLEIGTLPLYLVSPPN